MRKSLLPLLAKDKRRMKHYFAPTSVDEVSPRRGDVDGDDTRANGLW